MKIGISTYHRAHNYGALLQAVALRNKLTSLGHEVSFIDYWPDYHKADYALFNKYLFKNISFLGKLNYIRKVTFSATTIQKRRNIFLNFIDKYIAPFSETITPKLSYDAIVYGSDQIWGKLKCNGNRFDPFYFGVHNIPTKQHISYAASMGVLRDAPIDKKFLKETLTKFSDLGVRESDLKGLLEDCSLDNVHLTLDPTLLLDKKEWTNLLDIRKKEQEPYILFYDLMENSFDLNAIKEFSQKKGLKLKVLKGKVNSTQYGVETIDEAGPIEFINLIANAEFVFASSFHGLAFSIIFEKPFFVSYKNNSSRAQSLLSSLKLQERLLPPLTKEIPEIEMKDYKDTNELIKEIREKSLRYISSL